MTDDTITLNGKEYVLKEKLLEQEALNKIKDTSSKIVDQFNVCGIFEVEELDNYCNRLKTPRMNNKEWEKIYGCKLMIDLSNDDAIEVMNAKNERVMKVSKEMYDKMKKLHKLFRGQNNLDCYSYEKDCPLLLYDSGTGFGYVIAPRIDAEDDK